MRYPTWITTEGCLGLMDETFKEGSVVMQTRLMKVYHEFLSSEEYRLARNEEGNLFFHRNVGYFKVIYI